MKPVVNSLPPQNPDASAPGLHHEIPVSDADCHTLISSRRRHQLHWHENIEIAFPLEGRCRFLVDGVFYDAGPGDMIVTGPRVTHQFQLLDVPMKFVIFQLSPRNLQNFQVSPHAAKTFITRREIEADPALCRRIDTLFEWILADPASTVDHSIPEQQSLCVHLYCLLARYFPSPDPGCANEAELAEFHEIFRYVNEHYREAITVGSIAKTLYYSRNKLPMLFMKYTGTSLSDYIRELRIENAKQLLAAGSSITHAALDSGFQNIRTFNSNFRCQMEMSPSAYIQLMKKEPAGDI